ncbi:MAG: FAD-binding oxidoreductase, partial [Planctomycetes bacterium]|nr:FAD-binding oxidoreductase [Planctomycetota bacterium]
VIGIRAVDGRGNVFAAGGRVVKNAAGYDLCRLLTGSLGTLAVITQVTLRVKPVPEASAWMAVDVADLTAAERLLAELVDTRTQPVAIELLYNASLPESRVAEPAVSTAGRLFVGFEGTGAEVRWMTEQLHDEWKRSGAAAGDRFTGADAETVSAGLVKHSYRSAGQEADSLLVRIATMPGALTGVIGALLQVDPAGSIQAHAGDGMVLFRTSAARRDGIAALIDGRLRPIATEAGGYLTVQSAPAGVALSRETVWGPPGDTAAVMRRIKQKFDPKNLLNPGRFVYE